MSGRMVSAAIAWFGVRRFVCGGSLRPGRASGATANEGTAPSELRRLRFPILILSLACCIIGCGADSGSSPFSGPAPGRALLVGNASGIVLQTIQAEYQTVNGTGSEDPSAYSMIVFDGNNTTPAQLQENPGPRNFLNAGKPVVILNPTEDHLVDGLLGAIWAHAQDLLQPSPAVAFVLRHYRNGVPRELTQVSFPLHLMAAAPGESPLLPLNPTPGQLTRDSRGWLRKLMAETRALGNISPAVIGNGQTVLAFDQVTPLEITETTILQYATAQSGGPPASTLWGPNNSTPPDFTTELHGTFETLVYAMLEGNSPQTYQHKIFARQYLLVSPPTPLPTFKVDQYPTYGSCDAWTFPEPAYTTMGWNSLFNLSAQVEGVPSGGPLSINESLPQASNNVVTLTTSQSHTETVGVSATGGIQNSNFLGTVGVSWSDSWTWGQAQTVSFRDWEAKSCIGNVANGQCSGGGNLGAAYTFAAFAGSQISDAALHSPSNLLYIPWNVLELSLTNQNLPGYPPTPQLNQLQKSAMTNQSETAWETSSGDLLPAQTIGLTSEAIIESGEIETVWGPGGPCGLFQPPGPYTSWLTTDLKENISLNFDTPGLQPAGWNPSQQTSVAAPWTLTFAQPVPSGSSWKAAGTLALNSPSKSPTTVNLTYVIQPRAAMLTLPAGNVCPGATSTFPPGPGVISNNPLSLTIPTGQTQVSLAPLFEAEGQPYNVQVIAWQPETTINGEQVLNPQAAYCVTVPGQQP